MQVSAKFCVFLSHFEMPKHKTYFTCKSKHIKPIDEQCPFNVNVAENDNVSVVDNVDNAVDGVDNVDGC